MDDFGVTETENVTAIPKASPTTRQSLEHGQQQQKE